MLEDFSAQPNVKRVITFRNRPYVAAIGEVPVLVSLDRKAFFIANAVMPAEVLGAPTRRGVSRSAPCPRDQLPALYFNRSKAQRNRPVTLLLYRASSTMRSISALRHMCWGCASGDGSSPTRCLKYQA